MKNLLALFALSLWLPLGAQASVSIQFDFGVAYTAGGASQVSLGTIGVLVANTSGTGFALDDSLVDGVLTAGQSLGGNRILHTFSAADLSGVGDHGFQDLLSISDFTGITLGAANGSGGTQLGFYWFPGITTVGSTITTGQSFGFFRTNTIDSDAGSTISFNMPSDGSLSSLVAYETSLGGIFNPADFQANFTAGGIPEPSRAVLLGLAGVLTLFRRRRVA